MLLNGHKSDDATSSEQEATRIPSKSGLTFFSHNWASKFLTFLTFDFALTLAALLIALIGFLFGEKIKAAGGLGMDGYYYGTWAKSFYTSIFVDGVNDLFIQRILPSALVHYSLRLLFIPLTDVNVIRAFGILNVAAITFSAYIWCLIANNLGISRQGKIFGFMALFLNFAILKWASYYPVITDVSAYFISLLMLYFYLIRNRLGLFILIGLGAFVWPTLIYEGTLFLMFPRDEVKDETPAPARYWLNIALGSAVTVAILLYMRWLVLTTDLTFTTPILPLISLVHLSIAFSLLYVFFGLTMVWDCDRLFNLRYLFRFLTRWTVFAAVLFFFAIKWLLARLSTGPAPKGTEQVVYEIFASALAKPGVFYVAHVMFFGPIIILALFWWKPACRIMHKYGLGLILCVALGLLLSLNSESRHVMNFFPLVVPFLIKVTDDVPWRLYALFPFALLSLLLSKVWLIIGGAPIYGDPKRFSEQLFYMNIGPYMTDYMYSVQGTAVLIAGIVLYLFYVKKRAKRTSPDDVPMGT
jgi:hypothetical protein